MAKFGTFEDLLAITGDQLRQRMSRLRDIIYEIDPDSVEVVRLGDRAASYGIGPKKMSEAYCYLMPHAEYINLGFYRGAQLDDPQNLLEGSGKRLRHIKIRSDQLAESDAVRAMIEQAYDERRQALA